MATDAVNPTEDPNGQWSYFVAPIVLIAGVLSGLLLVIALLFCKYCVKKNRCPRLQLPPFLKWVGVSRSQAGTKSHQYESVASTASMDQTITPQISGCTRTSDSGTTSDTLRLENEIDAAVAAYRERIKSFDGDFELELDPDTTPQRQRPPLSRASTTPTQQRQYPPPSRASSTTSQPEMSQTRPTAKRTASTSSLQGDLNRRVSFILGEEKALCKESPKSSPARNSRYTEGDFHHLKSARIERPSLSSLRSLSDKEASVEEVISELTPMLSPVSEEMPVTKQIQAEIHAQNPVITETPTKETRLKDTHYWERVREISKNIRVHKELLMPNVKHSRHMLALVKSDGRERQATSLEICTPHERWVHERRKVKSYEEDFVQKRREVVDYDRSSITEFDKSLMCSSDFSAVIEGLSPEVPSKARYNDIGSFEDISDSQILEELPGLTDSETETVNGTHKYKQLWQLRSTLEEEDELSDTVRMEDLISPDMTSPDEKEPVASLTTSFESNTEPVIEHHGRNGRYHKLEKSTSNRRGAAHLLHPNYEHKRKTYQFSKNPRNGCPEKSKPGENSFDSVETMDTDGDVSESSRHEVTTTSFESTGTTDNTDSTGDSASHKLQQMRGDSGYKSLETQQSQTNAETQTTSTTTNTKRHIHFALTDQVATKQPLKSASLPETHVPTRHHYSRSHYFDRRAVKSASKKRRDFRSEKQNLKVAECRREGESDSKSDQPSGDSFEETPRRFSIFSKVGRSRSDQSPRRANLSRDYSVDEKTDALFNEFLRFDPGMEKSDSPKMQRGKLLRKNSESIESTRPKPRFGKNGRSASVDHANLSGVRILKALSPQDSIEEECAEVEEIMKDWVEQDEQSGCVGSTGSGKQCLATTGSGQHQVDQTEATQHTTGKSAPKVPTIRLCKQETAEV